jgi:tetratricopeptide (TPR) repeat protein
MIEKATAPLDRERILARFRAREIASACFAFAVSFSVYLFTLAPTITFGDSGELVTAAYTLGNAHPPGYPLWLLLAKLFSFMPIGEVAYRLNLMSALLDAIAIGVLALVISRTIPVVCERALSREAFESPAAGLVVGSASATAALILAFSYTFWHQSVIAEVYALNNLLVCVILLLLVLWAEKPEKNGLLFAISFLFGAGQANHQTLLLLGPALGFYIIFVRPRVLLSPKAVLGCAGLFFLGLCFYIYLPIRAAASPPINWGDPGNWRNFWFHFTRQQYRAIEVMRPLSLVVRQVRFFFSAIVAEPLTPILLVPALLTLGFTTRKGVRWIAFTVAAFFCTGVVFSIIANTELDLNAADIHVIYFLPAYVIVAMWLGYGIGMIGLLALRASRRLRIELVPVTIVAAAWLALPVGSVIKNYERAGMRNHGYARFYGETLMNGLKRDAVLLAGTDSGYAVPMYMKWVEGYRPDVSILTINRLSDEKYAAEVLRNAPNLAYIGREDYAEAISNVGGGSVENGGISGTRRLMRINGYFAWKIRQRNEGPIYYDEGVAIEGLRQFAVPSGLVMEIMPERVESISAEQVAEDSEYWDDLEQSLLGDSVFVGDIEARQKFSKCRSNIGALYFSRKMYPESESALNQAIRLSDRNMEAYAYLALLRREQGEPEEAVRIFGEYMRRDPWNTSARGFYESLSDY